MTVAVGLTGNIGCGKSSVARTFEALGAETIDADLIVHELLAAGGAAVEPVLAAFPEAADGTGGASRKRLAATVFDDPVRRKRLETILHPLVIETTRQRVEDARRRGTALVVVEAALLFEAARAGGPEPRERFDAIVVVTCDPAVQAERLAGRLRASGLSGVALDEALADARARSMAQLPQGEKARLADHVIDNSGSPAEMREQVRVIHSKLLEPPAAR